MRICVVDDDPSQTEYVAQTLALAGHVCHVFTDGKSLIHELKRRPFDLLLLDWNMPEMPGDIVLKWVKEQLATNLPVLFLTSRSLEIDVVQMLNAGADDYVVKPVSPAVLLARVEALLRRIYSQRKEGAHETYGIYRFDTAAQLATVNSETVALTQKEFDLALLLFRNLSRPLSRAHIRESVWRQDVDIPSRTIDTHVSQVRSKLVLRPQNGYRITPIYSYGYRLEQVGESFP